MPREFDDVYRAVVAAGEQSGALGAVLERLADDLEERQALKSKLIGAIAYPAIVSVIAVVIVIFLVTYVVPQVASVFISSKRALPALTVGMLALSAFLRDWGWLLLLALAAGGTLLSLMLRNEAFRLRFDAGLLGVPLAGRLARGYNAARFAGTLAMLAGAGVPILKALQAAAETLSNRAMRADALDALVQVREGAPLASALAGKKRFPGILAMFSRLGEQTGQLPQMLDRAAAQLGGEMQRRAMTVATLLEPLLIVAMGGVVMLIVLAVLLPIIQLKHAGAGRLPKARLDLAWLTTDGGAGHAAGTAAKPGRRAAIQSRAPITLSPHGCHRLRLSPQPPATAASPSRCTGCSPRRCSGCSSSAST